MTEGDLTTRLEEEVCKEGQELPAWKWRSLSAELVQSLYQWR
jgi:hypothetical protein